MTEKSLPKEQTQIEIQIAFIALNSNSCLVDNIEFRLQQKSELIDEDQNYWKSYWLCETIHSYCFLIFIYVRK